MGDAFWKCLYESTASLEILSGEGCAVSEAVHADVACFLVL